MDILKTLLIFQWLLISSLSVQNDVQDLICDGIIYFNHYYEKVLLYGALQEPINLIAHKTTGEIFFSHKPKTGTTLTATHRKIRVCDFYRKNCTDIETVTDGRAIGYDRAKDNIYFGGSNGIYKYDRQRLTAHFFAEAGKSIWTIFVREFFYYVEAESKRLYINVTGKFYPKMDEIQVENFYVSTRNSMYFSNSKGLYKAYTPFMPIFVLDKTMNVRQISENYYQNTSGIYFATPDGIYRQDKIHKRMEKVSPIDRLYGLTFMNLTRKDVMGNHIMIYANYEAIYTLAESKHPFTCLKELQEREKRKQYKMDWDLTVNYD